MTEIKEVIRYVTEDGSEFATKENALEYAKSGLRRKRLESFLSDSNIYFRDTSAEEVAEYLVDNIKSLKDIINDSVDK